MNDFARPPTPGTVSVTSLSGLPLPLLEALLLVAWSSGFIGIRFSIDHAPAFLVVFWRCVTLISLLLPLVWRELRAAHARVLLRHAAIGLLAMAGYVVGVTQGIALGVPSGLAALIADLLPLGTAIVAAVFLRQRMGRLIWVGLGLGLAGVMLVTGQALTLGRAPLWAYALPLLGMFALAVATLWSNHRAAEGLGVLANLWVQCAVSSLVFAGLALCQGGLAPLANTGFVISVAWTAGLSTLGGYGLYWVCMRRSSPTRVATVLYLSPAVTLLWGWLMFDEPLSWGMLAGVVLSATGIALVVRQEGRIPQN